jgi:hypothetical protein
MICKEPVKFEVKKKEAECSSTSVIPVDGSNKRLTSEFLEFRFVCECSIVTSQALVAVLFRKDAEVLCFTKISVIQNYFIRY